MDISVIDKDKSLNNYFKIDDQCRNLLIEEPLFTRCLVSRFHNHKIYNLKDLLNHSINELLHIRDLGPIKLQKILDFLDDLQKQIIVLDVLIESQDKKIKYDILIHKNDIFNGNFNCLDKKDKTRYQQAYNELGKDFVQWISKNPSQARVLQKSLISFRKQQIIFNKRRKIILNLINMMPKSNLDHGLENYITLYTENAAIRNLLELYSEEFDRLMSDKTIFAIIHSKDFTEIYKFLLWCRNNDASNMH